MNFTILGRSLVTFEDGSCGCDPNAAADFIRLNALNLRMARRRLANSLTRKEQMRYEIREGR